MVSKLGRFSFSSASVELKAPPNDVDQAERELTPVEVNAPPDEVDQAQRDLDRLFAELEEAKAALADREAAVAQAALDAQQARDRWQQNLTARVAAAETQSRQQSARSALAEVTAACEAAQQPLEQPAPEQAPNDPVVDHGAPVQHAEAGLEQAPLPTSAAMEDTPRESNIIIRTNRVWAAEVIEEKRRESKKNAMGGIVAAAALGMLSIAALVTGSGNPIPRGSVQELAVALRDVNVRAAPSTEAKVVSMLPRGVKVSMIEERGGWHLIRIEGAGRDTRPQQGWVNASFLKKETASPR